MKNFLMSALTISLFLSCEKKTSETVNVDESRSDTVVIPASNEPVESSTLQTCYMEAISKDSVFLSLDDNLGTITGKMRYKNFEKDSSFGDIAGIQNADTLKLMYTFESEGKTSDREIYFLRKGDKLMEATGEYTTDGSTSKYTNPSKLKYDGHQLQQIDCTNFDKKFTSK